MSAVDLRQYLNAEEPQAVEQETRVVYKVDDAGRGFLRTAMYYKETQHAVSPDVRRFMEVPGMSLKIEDNVLVDYAYDGHVPVR